ncbi:MAG: hypothetical protein ACERKZ_10565 [Lachnotalea sp.]
MPKYAPRGEEVYCCAIHSGAKVSASRDFVVNRVDVTIMELNRYN